MEIHHHHACMLCLLFTVSILNREGLNKSLQAMGAEIAVVWNNTLPGVHLLYWTVAAGKPCEAVWECKFGGMNAFLQGLASISCFKKHPDWETFLFHIFHLICTDLFSLLMATDLCLVSTKPLPYLLRRKLAHASFQNCCIMVSLILQFLFNLYPWHWDHHMETLMPSHPCHVVCCYMGYL